MRGITNCYKCRRTVGDGSLASTMNVFSMGSFFDMPYDCKTCGMKFCLDCMSDLKQRGGYCPACGKKLGW